MSFLTICNAHITYKQISFGSYCKYINVEFKKKIRPAVLHGSITRCHCQSYSLWVIVSHCLSFLLSWLFKFCNESKFFSVSFRIFVNFFPSLIHYFIDHSSFFLYCNTSGNKAVIQNILRHAYWYETDPPENKELLKTLYKRIYCWLWLVLTVVRVCYASPAFPPFPQTCAPCTPSSL